MGRWEAPVIEGELITIVQNFGAYFCSYCRGGQHQSCAGYGGQYGETCVCKEHDHHPVNAREVAFNRGVARMKAMSNTSST